jgi:hypothetical protein
VKQSKRQRENSYMRYVPVPDSIINSALNDGKSINYIDPNSGV